MKSPEVTGRGRRGACLPTFPPSRVSGVGPVTPVLFLFHGGCLLSTDCKSFFRHWTRLLSFSFLLFRASSAAHGGSRARGLTGAVGTGLHHSLSNAGSEPRLQPIPQPQQRGILNLQSEARDRTRNLVVPSQVR